MEVDDAVVERTGTIIEVKYPKLDLYFIASRIRQDTESCELEINWKMSYDTGLKSKQIREHVKLFSAHSKSKLLEDLDARTQEDPDRYNWGTIVDQTFKLIVDKHREGFTAEVMSNLSESKPRSYLVKPLLIEGVANLIWARGGSIKSYFALLLCVLVDKGWDSMGLSAKKGKALYLDWEEESDVFKQRLLAVQRGMNINDPTTSGIVYKKMVGSLANNVESISKLVYEHGITFVIVDSVSPALQGDSNSQDVGENFFWALRQLDVTSLCIDHANKSGETTGRHEIHGSSFKYASVDGFTIEKKTKSIPYFKSAGVPLWEELQEMAGKEGPVDNFNFIQDSSLRRRLESAKPAKGFQNETEYISAVTDIVYDRQLDRLTDGFHSEYLELTEAGKGDQPLLTPGFKKGSDTGGEGARSVESKNYQVTGNTLEATG